MPAAIAIPYFIIEILAFIGVVMWLGIGWAIGLLFIFFFLGLILAAAELRRIGRAAATQQTSGQGSPGAIAGNFGLTAAGAILVAIPGFVSSILGLLLIIPPTRALIRTVLAKKMRSMVENLGARGFEAVNGYRTQASYGSFGSQFGGQASAQSPSEPQSPKDPIVIDEEEIQNWTSNIRPEDFGAPGKDSGDNSQDKGEDK